MGDRESFEHFLPLELKPEEVRLWHGEKMQPVGFTDCDRLRITTNTIEFLITADKHL